MTNEDHTLIYTGMTCDVRRRAYEHRTGRGGSYTRRFKVNKLVYSELAGAASAAKAREKQIKAGTRQKKLDLVNGQNPEWKDLYEDL
jgi:putative endonuclease